MKKLISWLVGETKDQDAIFRSIILCVIFITLLISVLLGIFFQANALAGVSTFLMVSAACFAGGSAIGFLFGLPKKGTALKMADGGETPAQNQSEYEDNTNLQEVSDWLTKIIVGLSLIKLNTILGWIDNAARTIDQAFGSGCKTKCLYDFYAFGYGVIAFYFLLGAGLIYLWSRTNLKDLLSRQRQLLREKKSLVEIAQNLADQNEEMPSGRQQMHNPEIALADEPLTFNPIPMYDEDFRNQTMIIYNAKKILHKDDLQKGRWGGKALVNNKLLEAAYNPGIGSVAGLYSITLSVRSLDPKRSVEVLSYSRSCRWRAAMREAAVRFSTPSLA